MIIAYFLHFSKNMQKNPSAQVNPFALVQHQYFSFEEEKTHYVQAYNCFVALRGYLPFRFH